MSTSGTTGHPSTMDKIKAKVESVLHKDHSTTSTGSGAVREGDAGPHSSRAANAADPTVDSDLDRSRNAGLSHGTGHSALGTATGTTGNHTSGLTGNNHSSGLTGNTHNSGLTGNTHDSGLTGNSGAVREGDAGHHNNRVLNALDPKVDSDLDGSRNAGLSHGTGHSAVGGTGSNLQGNHAGLTGSTHDHSGTVGGLSNSTNAGPHDSNLANTVDPRVNSNPGSGNKLGQATGGILGSGSHATRGSGTAQNTDGPHNKDILNQLDPRVDSDRDASTTLGGNKTNY